MSKTKRPAPISKTPEAAPVKPTDRPDDRDYQLDHREAAAGAPADASVTGEEDPGAALEFLVKK